MNIIQTNLQKIAQAAYMEKVAISQGAFGRALNNRLAKTLVNKQEAKNFLSIFANALKSTPKELLNQNITGASRKHALKIMDDIKLLKGKKLSAQEFRDVMPKSNAKYAPGKITDNKPFTNNKPSTNKTGKKSKGKPFWDRLSTPAKVGVGAGILGVGMLPFTIPTMVEHSER